MGSVYCKGWQVLLRQTLESDKLQQEVLSSIRVAPYLNSAHLPHVFGVANTPHAGDCFKCV